VTLWTDVLARYPDSPRGWLNRGAARAAAGDVPGALSDYREALPRSPRNGLIHYNIGNILLGAGDTAAALKAYDTAAQLDSGFAAIYYYRAAAREQSGDLQGALADYDRAIAMKFFSHSAFPHFRRGALKARLGLYREALPDFDVTAKQVESSDAYYYRSFVKLQLGDRAGAAADFRQAERLSPDCPPELKSAFHSGGLMSAEKK